MFLLSYFLDNCSDSMCLGFYVKFVKVYSLTFVTYLLWFKHMCISNKKDQYLR